MERNGVNLFEVKCKSINPLESGGFWNDSNLFELFDQNLYDVVIGGHKGEPCWPFSEIKGPKIIETVHGTDFTSGASTYSDAYVLISEYQRQRWVRAGGDLQRTKIIYPMVKIEKPALVRDRKSWNIPDDKFVFGYHQAARPGLFSSIPLDAYAKIQNNSNFFVLLGGTEEYTEYAKSKGIINFMRIPPASSSESVNSFLSCLDVYAHGRFDGEVCSSAIIEAMAHGLPIITHPSAFNNGHLTQIEDCGFAASSAHDYANLMFHLQNDKNIYKFSSEKTIQKYENFFSFDHCRKIGRCTIYINSVIISMIDIFKYLCTFN
jgi:glycosyltransferase involved in cell wall biosynthesis